MFIKSHTRIESGRRLAYIADTTTSIGASFSSSKAVAEYVEKLEKQYLGEA